MVALAGGTGSAKLLRGLARTGVDLTVVANVGDNYWVYGLYVCPDLDIASYALAGIQDTAQGWGIRGDSFDMLAHLSALGQETWFRLGDRDMATSLLRTKMMHEGSSLTRVTEAIGKGLGVKNPILPATDRSVETWVMTPSEGLHLQEFWVREGGRPEVKSVEYRGASSSVMTPEVARAIKTADRVVVCPANPVTSIGPMLAIKGMKAALKRTDAKVVALSPMSGRAPFSGPAGKMMRARGVESNSVGVARMYAGFLDLLVVSDSDRALVGPIETLGIVSRPSDIRISGREDEDRLAKELVEV